MTEPAAETAPGPELDPELEVEVDPEVVPDETPIGPDGAPAPPPRPTIDARPLLTERQPEPLGRVAVRSVASALCGIAFYWLLWAAFVFKIAADSYIEGARFSWAPFLRGLGIGTAFFGAWTFVHFMLEGAAHVGWRRPGPRFLLCLAAGALGPALGGLAAAFVRVGRFPIPPDVAVDIINDWLEDITRSIPSGLTAAVIVLALAALARGRDPFGRPDGEYGIWDSAFTAAKWVLAFLAPSLLIVLGPESLVGAVFTSLIVAGLVGAMIWFLAVGLAFLDLVAWAITDSILPQKRILRQGDRTIETDAWSSYPK